MLTLPTTTGQPRQIPAQRLPVPRCNKLSTMRKPPRTAIVDRPPLFVLLVEYLYGLDGESGVRQSFTYRAPLPNSTTRMVRSRMRQSRGKERFLR